MTGIILLVTFLGAVSLFLMLPREKPLLTGLGGLIGALTLGGVIVYGLGRWERISGGTIFFYVFGAIMVAGAIGVICHPKPVYAALYFVLVSLAGAGIFVLLMAEFMAVVLIIVYAGAILVTYVFVIMLASQAGKDANPLYDRMANEPLMAVLVSFVLLGSVVQMMLSPNQQFMGSGHAQHVDRVMVQAIEGTVKADDAGPLTVNAEAKGQTPAVPTEIQALGINLYGRYAISLELAGVLLTIAMVGAVMIARKNVAEETVLGTGSVPIE